MNNLITLNGPDVLTDNYWVNAAQLSATDSCLNTETCSNPLVFLFFFVVVQNHIKPFPPSLLNGFEITQFTRFVLNSPCLEFYANK